ncbi:MAG: transporter [Oscillospiraceae bacterium]|jgi:drug/metabolite transporter (DMT)-like permease|nr:transporter [Oscillospiraceae bacterium]
MKKSDARVFLALHVLLLLFSFTTVLSKLAAGEEFLSPRFCLFFGGEFVLLGIYALGWQQILKRLPLTVAYTNKAVTLLWSLVFGALLFHETVSVRQIVGCALAVAGVILFVRADGEEEQHDG